MASHISPPPCYGCEDSFSETSRPCLRCPFRKDCERKVNAKVNRVAQRVATNYRSHTSYAPRATIPSSTARNVTSRVPGVVKAIPERDSIYNFDLPVVPQLTRYIGYSVAEVCLEELHQLVVQGRHDFISRLSCPVITTTVQDPKK